MKSVYVAELADGDDLLNEPFLMQDVVRRETKDGRPFLLGTFRDKTGRIGGVFWDVPDDIDIWVRPGLATLVTGRVGSFKNALQINATDLNPDTSTNMEEFLPASGRSSSEMIQELRQVIGELDQPWQQLVSHILLNQDFLSKFSDAPAARTLHHAYVGGLLEHTLSMVVIANFMAKHYPYVNKDLLISGVLIHDAGKTLEYDTTANFDFTDDGRLVGHIARSLLMVEQAVLELGNIGEHDVRQLLHLIASHHGTLEWGSPVLPKTLEAVLLHQIDLIDSRVQGFFDHVRSNGSSSRWTSKPALMFGTELRRPPGFK